MKSDYIPAPIDVSDIQLPSELCELAEIIAKNVHEVWAAGRLAEGWKYGPERNDALRTHPGLVPYEELSETEKDYDRRTAMETLKLIQKIGFGIKKEVVQLRQFLNNMERDSIKWISFSFVLLLFSS